MRRILIVEDEILIAVSIQRLLAKKGYQVIGMVASGEEAVLQAEIEQPDLLIMDINLQGNMNGLQAASAIRKKKKLPIVFVSANCQTDLDEFMQKDTDCAFVPKPINQYALETTLSNLLTGG